MASTTKPVNNIGIKAVYTPSLTIQPGETILTSAQSYTVNGFTDIAWQLAPENGSYVFSDLIVSGTLSNLQIRNMGSTAFSGRIILRTFYYPSFNLIYL